MKKISPGVRIENDEIKNVLLNEVLKREVLEGDKSDVARKKINKILNPSAKRLVAVEAPKIDSPIEEINKDSVIPNIEPNL